MNIKQLSIGSIVGGIVLYVVGYIIWDILLLDYYVANAGAAASGIRASTVIWAAGLGVLGYGALITYLISMQSGAADLLGGLKMGALGGFLLWFTANLIIFGFLDLWSLNVTILDIVLETVRGAIGGAVIGFVLSKVS